VGGVRRQRQRGERGLAVVTPQGGPAPQSLTQGHRLQGVLHPCAHPHPLVPVQQERPQIPHLGRGHPDRREAFFHQQLQQQMRVAPIVLLATRLGVPNGGRMPDAAGHLQLLHQPQKPAHGARGFDPHHDGFR
jgi:hypothetical protein